MSSCDGQPAFPLTPIALRMSGAAVIASALAVVVVQDAMGFGGALICVGVTASLVWLVGVASLSLVASAARRSASAAAMVHFAAAGGRVLLCIAAGIVAVRRLHLPAESVLLSMATIYMAVLMVESFGVARFVRERYMPARRAAE